MEEEDEDDELREKDGRILFNGVTIFTTSTITVSVDGATTATVSYACTIGGMSVQFCK